jgi:hypothetical protein
MAGNQNGEKNESGSINNQCGGNGEEAIIELASAAA